MARSRTPNDKAAVSGADRIHPGRFADRKTPKKARPLGEPYARLNDEQQEVWLEMADLGPWLRSHDRIMLEISCRMIARMRTESEFGVSAIQALSSILSKLGFSPTDVTKVKHDDGDEGEPEDRFFGGKPN